jgi:hypothetical protein
MATPSPWLLHLNDRTKGCRALVLAVVCVSEDYQGVEWLDSRRSMFVSYSDS